MSRHRNVRTLNVQEEYDGYFDVYGHSVEDDYCLSPSVAEFMYDRNRKHQISSLLSDESQIKEDEEWNTSEQDVAGSAGVGRSSFSMPALSADEEVKLKSCLDELRNIVGESIPETILIDSVLTNEFDFEKSLQAILSLNTTVSSPALPPVKKMEKHDDYSSIHIDSELDRSMSACRIDDKNTSKKSDCKHCGTNDKNIISIEGCMHDIHKSLSLMIQKPSSNACCNSNIRKDGKLPPITEDLQNLHVCCGNSAFQSLETPFMKDAPETNLLCYDVSSKLPFVENSDFSALPIPVASNLSSTSQLQALASVRLKNHDKVTNNVGSTFVVPKLFSGSVITSNKSITSDNNNSKSLEETVVKNTDQNTCKDKNQLIESDHKIDLALALRLSDACHVSDESEEFPISSFSRKSIIPQFDTYKLSVSPKYSSYTCSNVGKLLSLRLKTNFNFPFPHSSVLSINTNVPRFTFKVPSPDEILLNLRKQPHLI